MKKMKRKKRKKNIKLKKKILVKIILKKINKKICILVVKVQANIIKKENIIVNQIMNRKLENKEEIQTLHHHVMMYQIKQKIGEQ